ncbi:hypothetical protein WJU23_04625 [Prosthecobacter sp. SYSU 5D2]|uniref:hypothetical protein n=1 Tax=Prosthecobacter sp. SYSU 5D2 TaxID=3134134 RepID=UPI0031FF0A0B
MSLPPPHAAFRSAISSRCWRLLLFPLVLGSASALKAQINDLNDLRQLLSQNGSNTASTSASTSATPAPGPNTFYAAPGPWGKLRCSYIYLEAPTALVDSFPLPNSRPRWTFPEEMLSTLPEFFRKASLSQALITLLLSPDQMVRENGFVHLFPPLPDLESISPESRAFIYTELSKYPPNEFCVDPVLIVGQTVGEWYRTSKLRPALIAKIEQMCYKRGDTIAFSDVGAILNYAESDSEARAIFKAFTRTRSLMVKVEVDHSTNIDELVGYWTLGIGLRRKDIEPFVQSVIDTDGLETLPLSHLLPSLVRKLMYTYPGLDLAKHGMLPDCHWTSLNFFNYEPHEYLLDSRLATSAVLENFQPVEAPYKYGDILFFLSNTTGDAYHSCVHLADGIVFTKNGRNLLSPWLLMKLEDVGKIYLYKGEGRIQGFRRKNPEESIPSQ